MAKKIKNPIDVIIEKKDGETATSLHYGLECEYGNLGRTGFTPELTAPEQAAIDRIMDAAIAKINAHEGIA